MQTLNVGEKLTKDILAEILCEFPNMFMELDLHDKSHKVKLMKRIIFSFVSIKAKHVTRTRNKEANSCIRHKRTKEIIFSHE